jgi:hypothetical protein
LSTTGVHQGDIIAYDNSTTNKRTAINTPATDQNQCRRTSIYERSVISGSYSGRKREAHYTFLQHLMQVITIQRFYRDDANVACEIDLFGHSNPTDIMLKEWLYIAGVLMTIFFYLNTSQHNAGFMLK